MTVTTDASPTAGPAFGAPAWIAAASVALAAASVYGPVLAGLVRQWYDDADAAYGAVVAIAAVVAIRQRWTTLRRSPLRPSSLGSAAFCGAVALYVAGTLAADVFLLRVSFVACAAAGVLFVCGHTHLRVLAAPLFLLLIAIPLPSALVTTFTMPLQLAASRSAVALLDLAAVPVVRDGNVLTLSHVTLEVVEACSGMRSLVTLLAITAVWASLRGVTRRGVVVLGLAALPVALAGNGLRIAFTGMLAAHIGEAAARGPIHEATGWIAFVAMCAALAAVHALGGRCVRVARPA